MVQEAQGFDWPGIILFVVWLVLPPLYIAVIGRHYARRCQESAETAMWMRDELCEAQDLLRGFEKALTAHLRKLNARESRPDKHGRKP